MAGFVQHALAPFTLKGFYLLTWGTALGTNVWQSISGVKAFGTLPLETFGHLQSALQPLYFATSSFLSASLLATHLYFHPVLLSSPFKSPHWWQLEEGVQGILIVSALVPQLLNWLVIGPKAVDVLYQRHRLERTEGKDSSSQAMTNLKSEFSFLHGVASSLNGIAVIALGGLGLAVSM